jgi:hypothetical protein
MRSFSRGAGDIACTRLRWNSATNGSSGHPRMRRGPGVDERVPRVTDRNAPRTVAGSWRGFAAERDHPAPAPGWWPVDGKGVERLIRMNGGMGRAQPLITCPKFAGQPNGQRRDALSEAFLATLQTEFMDRWSWGMRAELAKAMLDLMPRREHPAPRAARHIGRLSRL